MLNEHILSLDCGLAGGRSGPCETQALGEDWISEIRMHAHREMARPRA